MTLSTCHWVQHGPQAIREVSDAESQVTETEIEKLLNKGVIVGTDRETGDFISSVFLREKKDGSHRMILNLKALNKNIVYHHFKMDTLGSVIKLKLNILCQYQRSTKNISSFIGKGPSTSLPVFLMSYVSTLGNLQSS